MIEPIDDEEFDEDLLDDNAVWTLTPKACFGFSLEDTDICDKDVLWADDRNSKFESAYIILEQRMYDAGYITDEHGETKDHKDSDKPQIIFSRTVKGFYPDATEEQISAAWDLFVYRMEKRGYLQKEENE